MVGNNMTLTLMMFIEIILLVAIFTILHKRPKENEKIVEKEITLPPVVDKQKQLEIQAEIRRAKLFQKEFNELMTYDVNKAYQKKEVD